MNETDSIEYNGYQIEPTPFPMQGGGYNLRVTISHHTGPEVKMRPFSAKGHFDTQEEANAAAIEFGKQIIDGNVEGLSIEDL